MLEQMHGVCKSLDLRGAEGTSRGAAGSPRKWQDLGYAGLGVR